MNISKITPYSFTGKIELNMSNGKKVKFDAKDIEVMGPELKKDKNSPYEGLFITLENRTMYLTRGGKYLELWALANEAKFTPDDEVTTIPGTFSEY